MDPHPPPHPYPPPPHLYQPPLTSTVPAAPTFTPTTVTEPVPPQNHIIPTTTTTHHVAAANPTPPPNPTSNHPPYAEMIYAAITALKEKDGSSKRAIAKYIERAYSGLPTTHAALLTHHLKRLKTNGHLVMVKKSYKLPRSDANSLPSAPYTDSSAAAAAATTTAAHAPSRGRGRPPKNKPFPDQQPISQQPILQQQPISIPIQQQQQQPNFQQQPISIPIQQQQNFQPFVSAGPAPLQPNSQPMLVALGLVDEPASAKRRPGRPRKVAGAAAAVGQSGGGGAVSTAKKGRGRPPGPRLPKKRAGRPPKPKSVSAVSGPNGHVKRGRGRPSKAEPKSVFFPYATNVPLMGAFEQNNVPNVVVQQQQPTPKGRGRGRPKKGANASAAAVGAGGLVPAKRGRQPGPPTRSSGRPVGRPKKNASEATTEAPVPNSVADGEFKGKLEYFQFKVRQAVGALKPYLNNESAASAIAAIQELEGLATVDISAPFIVEAPQQPVFQS